MSCQRIVYDMRPDFTSITIYVFADPFHKKTRFIHSVAHRVYGVAFEQGGRRGLGTEDTNYLSPWNP